MNTVTISIEEYDALRGIKKKYEQDYDSLKEEFRKEYFEMREKERKSSEFGYIQGLQVETKRLKDDIEQYQKCLDLMKNRSLLDRIKGIYITYDRFTKSTYWHTKDGEMIF